jgi:hypothetical protein
MNIGITGHQRLDNDSIWAWVEEAMRKELSQYSTSLLGVSSLAMGADQLFARIVLELGGAVHAIIPYAGIERSFSSSEDLQRYRTLVADATIETLDTPGSDQDAYLAAGFRVVDLSSLLIAVWDGLPAKGKGGTADVVDYASSKRIPIVHINPIDSSIVRVLPSTFRQ